MGRKNILAVFGFALAVALLPRAIGEIYYLSILIFIGIYCLITLGLSLLMGYAGQNRWVMRLFMASGPTRPGF
jgi:branched-chain amino acid transport system permease protein